MRILKQPVGDLAPQLAAASSRSVGSLALCVACVMLAMGVLGLVAGNALEPAAPRAGTLAVVVSAALSLLLYLASRSELVSPARLLDLGAGYYELVERLGQGGMGEVWKGRHHMLARSAAIKLIRPELIGAARPEEARQLVRRFLLKQACRSRAEAHASGLVHR